MSKKTDYSSCYNDDDFIETAGNMNEISVTITLCEYRNLIREQARSEMIIDRLTDENKKCAQQLEQFLKALFAKCPESMNSVINAVRDIMGFDNDEPESDDDSETEG